ncbi:MAG: thiamine pyrophosphate-dependent enzyme [Candidatus Eisenbacteria bacterium]|nr:dehydrogenase E1 component subunit alpha/beta [Candidatus Eisenbacteria bacterium]
MASYASTATSVLNGVEITPDILLSLYEKMLRLYYVEERMKVFVRANKCSFHASSRGHEKLQIAITMALQPGKDWFFPYYREKALMVGLGMPLEDIFLHMLSREGDPCGNGRNMSEHFSSRRLRVVSQTASTGTQYLPAVGMARAIKADGRDEIVYVSSGEGATSEGEFFEALNWASREQLPVLFVVQNNGFAISVPQEKQTGAHIHEISRSFNIRALDIDGTRFTHMYSTLKPLVDVMRLGAGPLFVEAHVVRLESHSSSDDHKKYRTEEELAEAARRDPLAHTEAALVKRGILTSEQVHEWRERIKSEVDRAAEKADGYPVPDPKTVLANIYSDTVPVSEEPAQNPASEEPVTMIDAINHGLREEMARNPRILIWGEDVADPKGGVFGVTRGLGTAFPGRVENSPLAEASIVGVASGMAMGGWKPVVEIQFSDYSWPGFMQMRNEIPTLRWRSQGEWSCPLVVRMPVGGYIRGGPFHSQSVEGLYAQTPGWRILFPSNAADAKGLIKTACRASDPVIFFEHKGLYRQVFSKSPEPGPDYLIPFGKARIAREGSDVSVIAWGSTVHRALQAAAELEKQGLSIEVIDLRSILPYDKETIAASVQKTGRAVVAHEAPLTGGFGAEIAAFIADACFASLDGPVKRVAALDSFVPFASSLEAAVLPSTEDVRDAILQATRF